MQEANTNTDKQQSTIEDEIKKKLPDQEKQAFFLTLFKEKDIQKSFSQKDISAYIKENPISTFFRILKNKTPEEQVKLLLEDIDLYLKNN